jgi:hypothetical protein
MEGEIMLNGRDLSHVIKKYETLKFETFYDAIRRRVNIVKQNIRSFYEAQSPISDDCQELLDMIYKIEDEIDALFLASENDLLMQANLKEKFTIPEIKSLIMKDSIKRYKIFNEWEQNGRFTKN